MKTKIEEMADYSMRALCKYIMKVKGCWCIGCDYCPFNPKCSGTRDAVPFAEEWLKENPEVADA